MITSHELGRRNEALEDAAVNIEVRYLGQLKQRHRVTLPDAS
jgi:hypothetical protein